MAKKKAVEETPEVEATQEAAQEQAPAPELSVQDLLAVRNIIDAASQRGAFRAAEMEAVGKTFNKLNTFLEAVTPKQEEPQAEE